MTPLAESPVGLPKPPYDSVSLELKKPGREDDMGTGNDQDDMYRMGKVQELKLQLRCSTKWRWTFVWTFLGFSTIISSLAEMASMAPTSGGQYHWVSEFASDRYQRILSYITGWMSVLAWQAGAASGSFLTGTIIQGLITVRDNSYDPKNWRGTLLVCSMILLIYLFNVYAARWMSPIQNILLALHILCWVTVVITLWTMAPRQQAKVVFTELRSSGGWTNMGIALMIGQISAIYASLSSDATAHMYEEVRDAGRYVPLAMYWGFVINGILALAMIITLLFAMPSVEAALKDPTGFPFIYVFKQSLSSVGVNGLTAVVLIPVIFSNILYNASTARQTYAFARDKGLPFSSWIAQVHPERKLPVNAIGLSCVISALLSLINIGSDTAFNAIISLNVAAGMWTYAVSIGSIVYRKLCYPETLPACHWSLGRHDIWMNIAALMYVIFALFWSVWPTQIPVTWTNFNWNIILFCAVFMISLVMYMVKGRKDYKGPVVDVKRE